jgi:demethylmenaquinone methyltransferase/2-methoxy-6-polyprenyl-1,4-benzoquinol methylase
MAELLSFGQNGRWRRFLASRVPADARLVLDVATGTARVAVEVAGRTPARVVGLDQSGPMLRGGRANVAARGLEGRISLLQGQAERLPFPDGAFDAVTFTYLLRYVDDPAATVAELSRVLKAGGVLANLEFLVPVHPLWRRAWWLYTRLVLPAAGRLAGVAWYRTGRFLGPSISGFYRRYPLPEQVRWWRAGGLDDVHVVTMSLGGGVVIWGTKRA